MNTETKNLLQFLEIRSTDNDGVRLGPGDIRVLLAAVNDLRARLNRYDTGEIIAPAGVPLRQMRADWAAHAQPCQRVQVTGDSFTDRDYVVADEDVYDEVVRRARRSLRQDGWYLIDDEFLRWWEGGSWRVRRGGQPAEFDETTATIVPIRLGDPEPPVDR